MLFDIYVGPGEYCIVEPLVKRSFNKKIFRPIMIEKSKRMSTPSSPTSIPYRPEMERSSFTRSVRKEEKESDFTSTKKFENEGHLLHEQRKVAFKILRDLVNQNTKQISLPVVKILNALQKVQLLKVNRSLYSSNLFTHFFCIHYNSLYH